VAWSDAARGAGWFGADASSGRLSEILLTPRIVIDTTREGGNCGEVRQKDACTIFGSRCRLGAIALTKTAEIGSNYVSHHESGTAFTPLT
jgi:hypothetical protein